MPNPGVGLSSAKFRRAGNAVNFYKEKFIEISSILETAGAILADQTGNGENYPSIIFLLRLIEIYELLSERENRSSLTFPAMLVES